MLTLQYHLAHKQLHNKWHTYKDLLLLQKFKTIANIFNHKVYVFLMVGKNIYITTMHIVGFKSLFLIGKKKQKNNNAHSF